MLYCTTHLHQSHQRHLCFCFQHISRRTRPYELLSNMDNVVDPNLVVTYVAYRYLYNSQRSRLKWPLLSFLLSRESWALFVYPKLVHNLDSTCSIYLVLYPAGNLQHSFLLTQLFSQLSFQQVFVSRSSTSNARWLFSFQ